MLLRLGFGCVVVAVSCMLADAAVAPTWTQIRISNFLFITDASESRLRTTVRKLEEFREMLVRATPRLATTSPVPTIVFVFADDRGLRPYHPRFEGGIKNVAGYFQPSDDVNYMAMAANSGTAFQIVFHEFVHFLIDNIEGETPSWFAEGLAQLYQTLQIDNTRGRAVLGAAPPGHMALLKRTPFIPLDRLIGVDEAWAAFHAEPSGREMFYAQSWALAHYLVIGSPVRRGQLDEYLVRAQSGDSVDQAITTAFGSSPQALEQELRSYLLKSSPPKLQIRSGAAASVSAPRGQPIDDAEVQAYLGDLLLRIGREDEGLRELRSLLDAKPDNARAAAALGSMELRASRPDRALPLLERAATLRPDDAAIQVAFGTALYDQAQRLWDRFTPPQAFENARDVLLRAAALDASVAPAHLVLGYAQMATGDLDRAAESIGRAIQLAPARKDYRLARARVLLRQRDYVRAEAELRPLSARARPAVREAAREMLETVAIERELGAAARPARPPARGFVAGGLPALRVTRDGEEGVTARFTRVDCASLVAVYHFQTERGDLQLTETTGGVQLIAYRPDAPRAVSCGPVPGAPRVIVTYRPRATRAGDSSASASALDVHGAAVAIEFIPDWLVRP